MQQSAIVKRLSTLLLFVGPATTLAISPYSNLDPINLIKVTVVSAIAFASLLMITSDFRNLSLRLPKGVWAAGLFFVFWMIVVVATSGAPLGQQVWGVFGRNNGFVSYFSLLVILVTGALIQSREFYVKLVCALLITAIPMTAYAVVQIMKLDPISWSVMQPFATLGNINFSSAFFGMTSICATVLALSPGKSLALRVGLSALVVIDLAIILQTGSIQGFMIFIAGTGVAGYFFLQNAISSKGLRYVYVAAGFVGLALTSLALNNMGPLARFVFSETIFFRFDYWYAGWAMSVENPITGVGLDSYGDWYRELRGEIATTRTGPDRITNTAHNIYLDISASGGFPLLLAYVFLLGYAARAAFRIMRREQSPNPYFIALFSAWVAYLIQAAISINQIGVGIWGWLFTGALIGYEIATREPQLPLKGHRKLDPTLPISAALLGIVGFVVGALVSFLPLNADGRYREASLTGDLEKQFMAAKAMGATAFHLNLTLDAALRANNELIAGEVVDTLLGRYPRDFMGWQVKRLLSSSTQSDRQDAYERLRDLDPFNKTIQPSN